MIAILIIYVLFSNIDENAAGKINQKYSQLIENSVGRYPYINSEGKKLKISPALVKAVIYQESRGNESALSQAGAKGLTQIMPQTAEILKCDYGRLNSPELAIDCSVKFLAALLTYNKGDLIKTLSGYNGGTHSTETKATTAKGLLADRIYDNPETKQYVANVLKWYEWFKDRQSVIK